MSIEILIRVRLRPRVRFRLRDMLGLELWWKVQSDSGGAGWVCPLRAVLVVVSMDTRVWQSGRCKVTSTVRREVKMLGKRH